jgi:heme-degrading monooxygenase HmoA
MSDNSRHSFISARLNSSSLSVENGMPSDNVRYARRVALMVKPEEVQNFLARMRREVFPNLKKQAGIRRMYLMHTPGESEFVSLTFWNDKSYADSYGTSSQYANNTESIRNMLESEPTLTQFDVDLHGINAEDLPAPKTALSKIRATTNRRAAAKSKVKKRRSRKS